MGTKKRSSLICPSCDGNLRAMHLLGSSGTTIVENWLYCEKETKMFKVELIGVAE